MREKPLIINLISGPCGGKSTIASALFAEMKFKHFNVELVTEVAKEFIWDEHHIALSNQLLVSANQHHRQFRLYGKIDYLITDCPLILGLVYYNKSQHFENFLVEEYKSQDNLNIFLKRTESYTEIGRNQNKEEAIILDVKIKELLNKHGITYKEVVADEHAVKDILTTVDYIENG